MKRMTSVLIAACASVFALSIAQAGVLVSEKEVMRQARIEWLTMKKAIPLEPNPRVQAYVQCVADLLIAQLDAESQTLDWEVVTFDDESINASANPAGKIAVLNGIFKVADTPDSLAAR